MKRLYCVLLVFSVAFSCPEGFYEDSCDNCWLPYCYDYVSHDISYDIIESECIGDTVMWIIPSDENDPNFNNYCSGTCPEGYMLDDCNSCWSSFCYTFFNQGLNGDPSHSVYYDLTIEECESYGYNYYSPDNPSNPYWNSNCNDVGDDGGEVDECADCLDSCTSYVMENYGYSIEQAYEWCGSTPSSQYGCSDYCSDETCTSGDANNDGLINVVDIVIIVESILYNYANLCSEDINNDGLVNVTDVVILVNMILGNARVDYNNADEANVVLTANSISLEANGYVGGAQVTLSHGYDFSIELADAFISDYRTSGNVTTFIIVSDGSKSLEHLASISGKCKIESAVIVNAHEEIGNQIVELKAVELNLAGPNPFNPSTSLNVAVPEAGHVSVKVYNVMGQHVATLADGFMERSASGYTLNWNASQMPSGVYLVRAETGSSVSTQKLMLLK